MIDALGIRVLIVFDVVRDFIDLLTKSTLAIFKPPFRTKETLQQLYFIANQSAPVVAFCVSFAAMVTIVESAFHMKLVIQNDSMVPGFASVLILRELGVVIASLLVTSRVGAGIAAEVGSMQVTEQVDALKMLGIDPVKFLVVPRVVAGFLGGMALTVVANTVCLTGAMVVSSAKLGVSPGVFLTAMRRFVGFQDLIFALIKGASFGIVIPIIACYCGFKCKAGAEGVGSATTTSVVASSVAIIVLDFILSWIFSHYY